MGYDESPWVFKGRALYQLQLVKVTEARKYIPDSLKVVSLFGYTLGGFYLARYSDSPVGAFDELVAVAGLVWNFPGSCAWAARVYVNDKTARNHGLQMVGLPSRQAAFEPDQRVTWHGRRSWWHHDDAQQQTSSPGTSAAAGSRGAGAGCAPAAHPPGAVADHPLVVRNAEGSPWWRRQRAPRSLAPPVARLTLPPQPTGWPGPRLTILLPSFSGATEERPEILQYTCRLRTNVRLTKTALLEVGDEADSLEALAPILGGKPLIAMNFHDMEVPLRSADTTGPHPLPSSQRLILVIVTRLELGLRAADPVLYSGK